MPRAAIHARRDLDALRPPLLALGLTLDEGFARRLLDRHRALDADLTESGAAMHFMRGPDEESAPQALRKALGFARARAWHAVEELAAALGPRQPTRAGSLADALADALHVVRDSYSSGHAVRRPRGTGPVVALRAWELDRRPHRGFGLLHALRHDLRFEWPFRRWSREVGASDDAVRDLVGLLVAAAPAAPRARPRVFDQGWRRLVAQRFLPPDMPWPDEAEDLPEAEAEA